MVIRWATEAANERKHPYHSAAQDIVSSIQRNESVADESLRDLKNNEFDMNAKAQLPHDSCFDNKLMNYIRDTCTGISSTKRPVGLNGS